MAEFIDRPKVMARIDAALDKIPYDGTAGAGAAIYREVLNTVTHGEYSITDITFDAINARIEQQLVARGLKVED